MAMKEAEFQLRRTGRLKDQIYADIIAKLREIRGEDVGGLAVFDNVAQAVEAYKSQPHTPELVTKFHQTIWCERGEIIDAGYEVTPCPYSQAELQDLERRGTRVGYLPEELATQENRHILGKMFPQMKSYGVQEGNSVTNDENPSGWFDYETGINAPYLDTTEGQLRQKVVREGRTLLSLNQYVVASQDSKLLTGKYLDEKETWVRLGSRYGGRVVHARFRGGVATCLSVGVLGPAIAVRIWAGVPQE